MEIKGREISEFTKIWQLGELHKTVLNLRRRVDARDSEAIMTTSHDLEKQPILDNYGKSTDLSPFLYLLSNWNVEAALKPCFSSDDHADVKKRTIRAIWQGHSR